MFLVDLYVCLLDAGGGRFCCVSVDDARFEYARHVQTRYVLFGLMYLSIRDNDSGSLTLLWKRALVNTFSLLRNSFQIFIDIFKSKISAHRPMRPAGS